MTPEVPRRATRARSDLRALFAPDSVAVVGASGDPSKPGGRILRFLSELGFEGPIYPINPQHQTVMGWPAYANFESLPEPAQLAVLVVPASGAVAQLEAAVRGGARAVIVCASGFREAGPKGAELEAQLTRIGHAAGIPVLGPNSLGLVNLDSKLAATFSIALDQGLRLSAGPIALLSQSGAMGATLFAMAQRGGIGIGKFISTGNEAVTTFAEILEYLAKDDSVAVILGYVEGLRDGRRFVVAAQQAREAGKSIALLKVGRTEAGLRAARSHTGALAGRDAVYEAAFRSVGIVRVGTPDQLLDFAFTFGAVGTATGPRVGVVSMSGGAGVLIADRCDELGLQVPALGEVTQRHLSDTLPAFSALTNPVDFGAVYGDYPAIIECARVVAHDENVDQLILFIGLSPGLARQAAPEFRNIVDESGKPLIVAWLGAAGDEIDYLRSLKVPAFDDPIRAVEVAAALWQAGRPLATFQQPTEKDVRVIGSIRRRIKAGRHDLSEREVKALLRSIGVDTVEEELARTPAEARRIAERFAAPVAVKVEAKGVFHKLDFGGVKLNVQPANAGLAFREVIAASERLGSGSATGAVIQPMVRVGLELLVGFRHDEQFGPVIVTGLGGTNTEIFRDFSVELAPISRDQARAMLRRLRATRLLDGFRALPARDIEAVINLMVRVSQLAAQADGLIVELDLNPVVVYGVGEGYVVVDAAAVLASRDAVFGVSTKP